MSAFNLPCDRAKRAWDHIPSGWTGANLDVNGGLALLFPQAHSDRVLKSVGKHGIKRDVLGAIPLVVVRMPYETHR